MVHFWVGVSGFSYASWRGVFYPDHTKPDKMLEAYSTKLNSVEINSTFYHMPSQSITSKWANSTGEDFRFSFKANRQITHIKKLREVSTDIDIFLKGVKPVDMKLGCVLVQLPPYLKQNYETLDSFLKQIHGGIKLALEFRHGSWFGPRLNELLSSYDAALCVADTEDMEPVFAKTANFTYARLRKDRYSKKDLKDWATKLLKFAEGSNNSFVYFKHDETGEAANRAVEFSEMLRA